MNKRYLCGFLCIAFLLVLSVDIFFAQDRTKRLFHRSPKTPSVGSVVEDFSLKTADGKTFTLSENRGKIIVLEFGACS